MPLFTRIASIGPSIARRLVMTNATRKKLNSVCHDIMFEALIPTNSSARNRCPPSRNSTYATSASAFQSASRDKDVGARPCRAMPAAARQKQIVVCGRRAQRPSLRVERDEPGVRREVEQRESETAPARRWRSRGARLASPRCSTVAGRGRPATVRRQSSLSSVPSQPGQARPAGAPSTRPRCRRRPRPLQAKRPSPLGPASRGCEGRVREMVRSCSAPAAEACATNVNCSPKSATGIRVCAFAQRGLGERAGRGYQLIGRCTALRLKDDLRFRKYRRQRHRHAAAALRKSPRPGDPCATIAPRSSTTMVSAAGGGEAEVVQHREHAAAIVCVRARQFQNERLVCRIKMRGRLVEQQVARSPVIGLCP